mgnify:CR=1 FL=1
MEEILEKSQVKLSNEDDRSVDARGFTPGQSVGVTQKPRVSGAGNGYFEISGANSYGYCAENKKIVFGATTKQDMEQSESGTIQL